MRNILKRALRPRRVHLCIVLALLGTSIFVDLSPAAGAPVEEPPPLEPAWEHIRPLDELVHEPKDRRSITSTRGTQCGFFIDGARRPPWFPSETGRHPGEDSQHAEENIDLSAVRSLLQDASATGKTVVIVCNRTPCSSHHRCDLILEQIAGEAAALGPPARLVFAFTGRYEAPAHPTEYQALKEIAHHGHEIVVALPAETTPSAQVRKLSHEIRRMHADGLFAVGSNQVTGPAHEALTGQTDENGGIDFSTLELRYVAEPAGGDGFQYAFAANPGTGQGGQQPDVGMQVAELQSDAFFTWLSLPTSAFWVNLNPDEPHRIIDEQLGRTDAGRILLEADLQMKRTAGRLTHPDNPLGAEFWNQLKAGADDQICLSFRQWIVPGEAVVSEDRDGLHILDAPLTVQLETEYFATQGVADTPACVGQDPAVEDHNEAVFRSLVLPEVERAVNEAPEYADLRRVYLSRVAAEWYRQRSLQESTTYGDLVDSGDVDRWTSEQPWSPRGIFDQYVESYTQGEYDITRETRQGDWILTHTYIYGGVDFATVPFDQLTSSELDATRPGLPDVVEESFSEPTADAAHGEVWLGAATTPSTPSGSSRSETELGAPAQPDRPRDQRDPRNPFGDGDGQPLGPLGLPLVGVAVAVVGWLLLRPTDGSGGDGADG